MKKIKSVILICVLFFSMSFLYSCGSKEVVGPQGPQGVQGEPGRDGTSLLTGNGIPSSNLGKNDDSYIDLDSWNYYIKTNNEWVSKGNIKSDDDKESEVDHKGTEGLEFYPLNDTECAVAVGTAKLLKQIEIPSKYKDYTVTIIMPNGFASCNNLESIVIPSSVTSIENNAFFCCSSLTSITIPDSVTSIGNSAFAECDSLTSITIPDSVTSIGNSAFAACDSLVFSTYGNAKYLGNDQNPYLVLVDVSDSLSKSYQIHNNTVFICNDAFGSCNKLISIVIPNSVTSIGSGAFSRCSSLESIVIPDSVTSIGSGAFYGCSSLTSITIPDSVTSIGEYAFSGCSSLESITIPDSVTSIGSGAFEYCSSLESIVIPDSVTSIGSSAFYGCGSLESVYYNGTIEDWCNIEFSNTNANPMSDSEHFYILNESNEYYEVTEIEIPNTVTSIGYQFTGFDNITKVVIPPSVTSIGEEAFYYCSSLESIVIPPSVTSIGKNAFLNCYNLENVYYEGTLEDWCNIKFNDDFSNPMFYAEHFYMKDSNNEYYEVTEIEIPNTVTNIDSYQFYSFDNILKVVIPSSVTSIGEFAFFNCSSLTSIVIPNSVISIGERAFEYCPRLTIYCELTSKPSGWASNWNPSNRPVVFGYTIEE